MKNVLKYKGFVGSVHFSAGERVFFGKIEGINELVTFEGATVEELEQGFQSMVDEHIKEGKKEGKLALKPYKGSFYIHINPDLHRQAVQIANVEGITLNQWIQRAILRELETEE